MFMLTAFFSWSLISYQFLDDAYNNHKHHMASMTRQLQEKKKVIDEVSHSIDSGYGSGRGAKTSEKPMSQESLVCLYQGPEM